MGSAGWSSQRGRTASGQGHGSSLARQASTRLWISLAVLGGSILVAGSLAYRAALARVAASEADVTARTVQRQLLRLDRLWAEQAAECARGLEADGVLAPRLRGVNGLEADLGVRLQSLGFRHVLVATPGGEVLFHYGPREDVPTPGISSGRKAAWLFAPEARTLYRVYTFHAVTTEKDVRLVFLRAIDDRVFEREGHDRASLSLVWQGQLTASSGATPGAGVWTPWGADGPWVERRVAWTPSESSSPLLVVRRAAAAIFTPAEMALGLAAACLLVLGLVHVALGTWAGVSARRVARLADLATEVEHAGFVSPTARQGLRSLRGPSGDEIDRLALSVEGLGEGVSRRDAERAARERVLRETADRVRETAASLEKGEERFRLLFNRGPDAAFVYGLPLEAGEEPRFLEVNDIACRLLGYNREELLRMGPLDVEWGGTAEQADQAIAEIRQKGEALFDRVLTAKDGSRIPVEIRANLFDVGGRYAVLSVARDLSERKEAEAEYRAIVQASTDGFLVVSCTDGRLLDANPTYLRMTGYTRDELVAMRLADLEARDSAEGIARRLGEIVEGRGERFETCHRRKDGSLLDVEVSAKHLPTKGGLLVAFVRDIGERKRAEQRQAAGERALRAATQLAESASRAKTEFLANMGHEIRTPMNAIIGLTHLVLETGLTARQQDYLRRIQAASKALLAILNAILDYSKIEAGHFRLESASFSLQQVLRVISDLFSAWIEEKSLSLTIEIAPGVPDRLVGDSLRLSQVLSNLVGNAIKFTERGGVRVSVSVAGSEGDFVVLRFSIADTGIGLSGDQGDRVFQAFTQADSSVTRRYGGVGLGLTISRRLVEMMGGKITFDSQPGQGSVFTFTARLRVALDDARSAAVPEGGAGEEGVPAGARVLLAEDNEINLMVARVFLENAGLIVSAAHNGREAVELAAAGNFDAILMDVQMPEMDGLEATRRIRAEPWGRDVPIVAMTAAAGEEDRAACRAAGMSDHVSKPIAPAELLAVLARWVGATIVRASPVAEEPARQADDALPASLPGFDLDGALARIGADRGRLASVLWRFAADFRDTPGEMERLMAAGDIAGAAGVAHRVKGTAGTVGASEVEAAAAELERGLRSGGSGEALPSFTRALRSALEVISTDVPKPGADRAPVPFDRAVLAGGLRRLQKVLDEHDLVPEPLLEEVCGQLAACGVGRLADALKNEVESYDYARALQTLDAVVHALDVEVNSGHA